MYNFIMLTCLACKTKPVKKINRYCSNKCQGDYEYRDYIIRWKKGEISGSRGINTKNISAHLVRYIFEKYDSCSICGWRKLNPITGRAPLEIDHIDGNAENNNEDNLRLICPNCHSLTPNFRNLNKGKGRSWRRLKYTKTTY